MRIGRSVCVCGTAFMNLPVPAWSSMQLFRWEELELLICGSPELDFEALEEATRYEDGYHADHPTIINFWKVVHAMSLEVRTGSHPFASLRMRGRFWTPSWDCHRTRRARLRMNHCLVMANDCHACCMSTGQEAVAVFLHRLRPRADQRPRFTSLYNLPPWNCRRGSKVSFVW